MECKYRQEQRCTREWVQELIETLWNVNTLSETTCKCSKSELIETLWNVNHFAFYDYKNQRPELIETLWNVNMILFGLKLITTRINRNIVECKFVSRFFSGD